MAELAREDLTAYWNVLLDPQGKPLLTTFHHQPRALFFVKILSVVCLLTNGNYWLSSMYFSLFSFSGLWVLANVLIKINNNKTAAILAFILFPSVLFWSSGILKESISIGALAFLTASLVQYSYRIKRFNIFFLVIDLLLLFLLWKTKYYYAAIFFLVAIPLSFTFLLKQLLPTILNTSIRQALVFFILIFITLFGVSLTHPNFYFSRIMLVIVDNHDAIVSSSELNDIIHFSDLSANASSMLRNAPLALISGLFRPFLGESADLLKIITGLENLFLVGLLVSAIFSIPKRISDEARIYVITLIIYILIMAIMLALSTPNFGTLTRYKVGFLPYLIYLLTVENKLVLWVNQKLF